MTIEVNKLIDNIINSITSSNLINSIMYNPIYLSIVIVVIMMIMVLIVFRDYDSGEESLGIMNIRLGFYMVIILSGIMLLNNRILLDSVNKTGGNEVISNSVSYDNNDYGWNDLLTY